MNSIIERKVWEIRLKTSGSLSGRVSNQVWYQVDYEEDDQVWSRIGIQLISQLNDQSLRELKKS